MTAETEPRGALVLLATGLGLFMIFLDATIVNVALPDIQADFDVGEEGLQWVVASYSLTVGMFMMSSATLSDRIGRRKTYVIGILIFCLASLGCGLAPNIAVLNLMRAVQNVRDYSPERAGAMLLAFSLPTMVLAPIAGRLTARYGGRRPTLAGLMMGCVGAAMLALTTGGPIAITMVALVFLGSAGGLAVAPATSMAMASIEPERSVMASGILSSQRALGSTAGFAILGSVLAATVAATLPGDLEPVIPDPATRQEAVDEIVEEANPQAVASIIGPKQELPDGVKEELAALAAADAAFVDGIRVAEGVAFAVLLGALLLGRAVFPKSEDAEEAEETGEAESLEEPT